MKPAMFSHLMTRLTSIAALVALAGCATAPYQPTVSPCYASEASYECQVERYNNVNVQ